MLDPIYICGSTASGKSSFAITLAKLLDGEIINGDAYQVYKGIEVISAAPSKEELAAAPHHLFSCLDCSESMDAQRYRDLALACIAEVQSRHKRPIVVGGSGMYLKFLTHGPSPVPSGSPELRQKLELETTEDLAQQLTDLDPEGAVITNLQNRRYVIRALEICILSGQKMSLLKSDWASQSETISKSLIGAVLQWDTDTLRQRIHRRTSIMLESGAIEEIEQLQAPSGTCEKAIGISTIRQYLKKEITLERCHELIFFATCQYAKRQRTWFKKESWLTPLQVSEQTDTQELARSFIDQLD